MESERSVQESTDRTHDLLKIECTKDEKPISSQVEDRQKQDEVESEEKLAVEQQGITEGQQLTASVAASDQNSVSEQLKCRPTTTTSDSEPSPSISEVRNTTATRGNGKIALTVKESENSEGTKQESVLTKNLKLYSKMLEDQDDSTESSFEQEEPDHSCKTFMEKKVMPRIAAIMSNVDKECDTSLASELATSWVRIDGAHESEELRTDEERREHEEQSEKKLTKIVRGEINVESDGAMAQTNLIVWNSQDESRRSEVQGKSSEIEAVAPKTREGGDMLQMERKEDTNREDNNEEAKELDDLVIAVSEDVRGHLEEKGASIADEHSTNQLNTSNP
ncbi:unnamed protein product, partial [Anisakis simplex]|uniref:Fibrous sheath-interacting protein 1 n=1 Tax=Anisakis simplex TaxID=6269 RepID=A0A0M3JDQ3_ANISI